MFKFFKNSTNDKDTAILKKYPLFTSYDEKKRYAANQHVFSPLDTDLKEEKMLNILDVSNQLVSYGI